MGLWDHMKPAVRIPAPLAFDRRQGALRVTWDDGILTEITPRELRIGCPCAACVEEWSGRRMVKPEAIPEDIGLASLQPVGNYAVTATFSDGHSTGIYSWKTLRALGNVMPVEPASPTATS